MKKEETMSNENNPPPRPPSLYARISFVRGLAIGIESELKQGRCIESLETEVKLLTRCLDHWFRDETMPEGCICHLIIATDETRHFRECPKRAEHPEPGVTIGPEGKRFKPF